jgi:hypothetical protein
VLLSIGRRDKALHFKNFRPQYTARIPVSAGKKENTFAAYESDGVFSKSPLA